MADVTIKYKDNVIAEIDGKDSKTLNTSGCYCESDIVVDYTPSNKGGNSKTYEITLVKASGEILLLELDDDVLEHMDEDDMVVSLINVNGYEFESYSVALLILSNTEVASQSGNLLYGVAMRQGTETATTIGRVTCPANNTGKNITGNVAYFILDKDNKKYYIKPGDGFIRSGNYRLTFSW
jgi:hypothetical protein